MPTLCVGLFPIRAIYNYLDRSLPCQISILVSLSFTGYGVSGDHQCGVYVRNDGRANVSDNTDTCADAQYLDGRGMVDGKVQQTVHSRTDCAAS